MLFPSLLLWLLPSGGAIPQSTAPPSLTAIARESIKAPFWDDYFWLSSNTLLSWQRVDDPAEVESESSRLRQYSPLYVSLDGDHTLLLNFYKSVKATPENSLWPALSLDRKWMLWFSWPERQGPISLWEAASLDETKFLGAHFPDYRPLSRIKIDEIPHKGFQGAVSPPVWRKDGHSWVMVRGTRQAPLYDLFSVVEQALVKEIALPSVSALPVNRQKDTEPYLLGYLSENKMLGFADLSVGRKEKVEAFTLADDGDPKSLHRFTFSLPQQGIFDEVQLSPNGDRLIWLVYVLKSVTTDWNLDTVRRQVWVSSWNGKDWKLIGDFQPQGEEKFPPRQVRWLVDGKRISFLYHQKLWIAPVK